MISIVFIPGHGFSWNETNLLNFIDTRLHNQRISRDRLTTFAPAWFKHQLEYYAGTHGIEPVYQWCQHLSSPLSNRFILLPRPKSFAKWLLSTPSANIWHIPPFKLKLALEGKQPVDLYDDVLPLLEPGASVQKSVDLISSNPIVYTRTQHVFGGPLYLATDPSSYSGFISPTVLSQIFKCDAEVPVFKRSELHLTIVPNLTSPRTFMLQVPNQTLDANYPLSAFNTHLTSTATNRLKIFPLDALAWRLLKGSPKPEWTTDFDDAFKALRLSRPAIKIANASFGVDCELCHLECKLTVDPRDNPSPRKPLKITLLNVPVKLLTLFGLTTPKLYPLRREDGNVVPWFLVTVLMSDGAVLTGSRRPVLLQTAHAELQPWWEVELTSIRNPHMSRVRDGDVRDIFGVAVALPKGSYKSTFIDAMCGLISGPIDVFPQTTVTDSDDLGDSLNPTFETVVTEAWAKLGEPILETGVRSLLSANVHGESFPPEIYTTFSDLYRELMLPAQRARSNIIARRGRSLAYAHTPYEYISANVPIQVFTCCISIDATINLLARPKRVGGVTGQLLMDHCYRLIGATLAATPVGVIYRTLFGPWLEYAANPCPVIPIYLMTEISAASLRAAGWSVDGDEPLRLVIMPALVPADSLLPASCPIPTASRASVICESKDVQYVSMTPPMPVKLVSPEILLPVTSVVHWLDPRRIILSGELVSLKGAVVWDVMGTPS
ncbi:VP4 [Green River chinook virus]|uniref:VP4 n=1 Tax=Green River chinook virus TaxID=1382300 RepID=W6EKE4_9REOV|nr:VP4 [Green River chinook virus]AHJ14804.1 VP4 [Green River chinook virus]